MEATLRIPKRIRFDVTAADGGTQNRAWDLEVTVEDQDGQPVAELPIQSGGQTFEYDGRSDGGMLRTDSHGKAAGRLYLAEPPESQTHDPGIRFLRAEADGEAVTFSFKVFDWQVEPLEGVAVELVAASQGAEPLRVVTSATGEASGTLKLA